MKIALLNHGCAKNLVDSELMLGLLAQRGHQITLDEKDADIVVVNTCSFIHDAEKESVQSILQMVQDGKKVIVTGCLPQKYKGELKKAIPEISGMIGTSDIKEIIEVVAGDGAVTVQITGELKIKSIKIDPTQVDLDDIGELEHWIEIAVRDGLAKAQEVAAEKMKPLMGGLGNLGL